MYFSDKYSEKFDIFHFLLSQNDIVQTSTGSGSGGHKGFQ